MGSSTREQVVAAYDALRAAVCGVQGLTLDGLSSREWMALAERQEIETRRLGAARHPLLNLLAAHATAEELGDTLDMALANRLRISPTLARRWIADAAELGPRRALTGQPLAPALGACAQPSAMGVSARNTCGSSAASGPRYRPGWTCRPGSTPKPT